MHVYPWRVLPTMKNWCRQPGWTSWCGASIRPPIPDAGLSSLRWGGKTPPPIRRGHIPGARYFALDTYEHAPLWTRVSDATLAERLVAAGIRYDTTVVLYGRDTTAAARAAVLLMYAGVDDVRLLDGGFTAWRAAGYAIETTMSRPDPVTDFGTTLPRHPEYLIGDRRGQSLCGGAQRDTRECSELGRVYWGDQWL